MFRSISALCLALFLFACASSPNMVRQREGGPDLTQDAVLVYHGHAIGRGVLFGEGDYFIWAALQEIGTQQHFYMWMFEDQLGAVGVPPGSYFVRLYVPSGELSFVREPLGEEPFDPNVHIPLGPIEVEAGEVIYLGKLVAEGRGIGFEEVVSQRRDDIEYRVELHEDEARAWLQERAPELAERMETRPWTIHP